MASLRLIYTLTLSSCLLAAGCTEKEDNATETAATGSTTATGTGTSGTSGTDAELTTTGETTTEASTGTETTDDETTVDPTTGGGEPDPACACIDPEQEGSFSYVCPAGPCPTIKVKCDDQAEGVNDLCNGDGVISLDVEALDCAIDQMIAGTPGLVEIHEQDYIGASGAYVEVGKAQNLMRYYSVYDLSGSESAVGFVKLKDKAYFEGCKAEPDPQLRYLCLKAWTEDEPEPLCDEYADIDVGI